MSFFKKLKKDIGLEGEKKKDKKKERKIRLATAPAPSPGLAEATAVVSKLGEERSEKANKQGKNAVKVQKLVAKEKKTTESPGKREPSDWLESEGQLAVDVYQTDDEFCVEAPIAGVSPEEIEVYVENDMLVIKGERKGSEEKIGRNYFYQECYWGSFSRQIILPEDVDSSKIKATLKKGILKVVIPRSEKTRRRRVSILSED